MLSPNTPVSPNYPNYCHCLIHTHTHKWTSSPGEGSSWSTAAWQRGWPTWGCTERCRPHGRCRQTGTSTLQTFCGSALPLWSPPEHHQIASLMPSQCFLSGGDKKFQSLSKQNLSHEYYQKIFKKTEKHVSHINRSGWSWTWRILPVSGQKWNRFWSLRQNYCHLLFSLAFLFKNCVSSLTSMQQVGSDTI